MRPRKPSASLITVRRRRGGCPPPPPPGATYVLAYMPPSFLVPPDPDSEGWWEIRTVADFAAGTPADDPPNMDGPPCLSETTLAGFAERVLGCPLTLIRFDLELKAADKWLPAPGYFLTPAGSNR